jgi:hypothetical protein
MKMTKQPDLNFLARIHTSPSIRLPHNQPRIFNMLTTESQTTQPSIAQGQSFYGATIDDLLNNDDHDCFYGNSFLDASHEADLIAMDELAREKDDDARIYAEQDAEREEEHRLWKASVRLLHNSELFALSTYPRQSPAISLEHTLFWNK